MFKPYLDFWLDLGFISFKTIVMNVALDRDQYEIILLLVKVFRRWYFCFNLYQPGYKELSKNVIIRREAELRKLRKRLADSLVMVKVLKKELGESGNFSKDVTGYNTIEWLVNYVKEEQFSKKHIEALQMIAGALNWSERTEEKVLQFAARINMEVENDR